MEKIKCQMYESKRAFDIVYKGCFDEVLCEVLKEKCPYGNESDKVKCMDNQLRTFCKSKGLIDSVSL